MENSGENNLGQQIQNMVQDAVKNKDFQRLSQEIGDTARIAIEDIRRNISSQPERGGQERHGTEKDYQIIRDANGRFRKIRTGMADKMNLEQERLRQQPVDYDIIPGGDGRVGVRMHHSGDDTGAVFPGKRGYADDGSNKVEKAAAVPPVCKDSERKNLCDA